MTRPAADRGGKAVLHALQAAAADVNAETASRIKALYRIMQSVEVEPGCLLRHPF